MSGKRGMLSGVIAAVLIATAPTSAAFGEPTVPAWDVRSVAVPTNFQPGDSTGKYFYEVTVSNGGGGVTDGSPIVVTDVLPAGIVVEKVSLLVRALISSRSDKARDYGESACETAEAGGQATVTCTVSSALPDALEPTVFHPSEAFQMVIYVSTPPDVLGALVNRVEVQGGGALTVTDESQNRASFEAVAAGFSEFSATVTGADGQPVAQSADHPYQYTTSFAVNTRPAVEGAAAEFIPAQGSLKDLHVALPAGLVGNPLATERCTPKQFNTVFRTGSFEVEHNACPDGSAVGLVVVRQLEGFGQLFPVPLYNLIPPKGMPAQLGFQIAGLPNYINTSVRAGDDYGILASLRNTTEAKRVTAASVTIWGVPGDSQHDRLRGRCLNSNSVFSDGSCGAEQPIVRPFLRVPTACSVPLVTEMSFDIWPRPGASVSALDAAPPLGGCELPPFDPSIETRPTTSIADSPAGLHIDVHLPQNQDPEGLGEADLKDTTVVLPRGLVVNPSSAGGLTGCSLAQIGFEGSREGRHVFSSAPANCPGSSKIGSVEIETPLVDHPLPGAVYVARQGENPFGSLLAIYIAVSDPQTGVVVKLPGRVEPDSRTGQLTTTVENSPQLPFEDFKLDFFGGPRASLRTPGTCGTYNTVSVMRPWTAPSSGPDAMPADAFQIDRGPAGGCPSGALDPRLSAGLADASAATYSAFDLRVTRADATGEFGGLTTVAPAGLAAKLRGIPYCPESGLQVANARRELGGGAAELSSPSCPAASLVGTVTAGAGAGPNPFYTSGQVYLAGPYNGGPISLVAIIPAVAGPFDLGLVVNRIALRIDLRTAQVTAIADPLPTILSGIPLDVRDIRVSLNRPGFTLAPTNCQPQSVSANVLGTSGGSATVFNRFQVGGCRKLNFKPRIKLRLKGATKRSGHPALKAVVTYPKKGSYANIARAQVGLPHSEFLDQGNLDKVCLQADLRAGTCPKRSIYGRAKAWTPLLDKPLEGPVYLGVGFGYKLPALVADLNGQVRILLVGRVDTTKHKGIRNTFEVVPDAPVSRFVLQMKGGKRYGLLENSENVCRRTQRASTRFVAQNGKSVNLRPVISNGCRKKHQKRHKRDSGKARGGRRVQLGRQAPESPRLVESNAGMSGG